MQSSQEFECASFFNHTLSEYICHLIRENRICAYWEHVKIRLSATATETFNTFGLLLPSMCDLGARIQSNLSAFFYGSTSEFAKFTDKHIHILKSLSLDLERINNSLSVKTPQ